MTLVALIIGFPKLVSSGLGKEPTVDVDKAFQQMQMQNREPARDTPPMFGSPPAASATTAPASAPPAPASGQPPAQNSDDEAMKRLLESMQGDKPNKP